MRTRWCQVPRDPSAWLLAGQASCGGGDRWCELRRGGLAAEGARPSPGHVAGSVETILLRKSLPLLSPAAQAMAPGLSANSVFTDGETAGGRGGGLPVGTAAQPWTQRAPVPQPGELCRSGSGRAALTPAAPRPLQPLRARPGLQWSPPGFLRPVSKLSPGR